MTWGPLTSPDVSAAVTTAQETPEHYIVFVIKNGGPQRTDAQNRMFRMLCMRMAQHQGTSVAEVRDYLVERFLGADYIETEDGFRKLLPSTADMTVGEFSSFLTACLTLAQEMHIHF